MSAIASSVRTIDETFAVISVSTRRGSVRSSERDNPRSERNTIAPSSMVEMAQGRVMKAFAQVIGRCSACRPETACVPGGIARRTASATVTVELDSDPRLRANCTANHTKHGAL